MYWSACQALRSPDEREWSWEMDAEAFLLALRSKVTRRVMSDGLPAVPADLSGWKVEWDVTLRHDRKLETGVRGVEYSGLGGGPPKCEGRLGDGGMKYDFFLHDHDR